MFIKNLKLTNYRNHIRFETTFSPDITLIFGNNGSGKTNILESLHLMATGNPFKASYDKEIIAFDKEFARVDVAAVKKDDVEDETKLTLTIQKSDKFLNASSKKFTINKVPKAAKDFVGTINTVLFCPEDLEIITHSPSLRRRYMDAILGQTDKEYKRAETNYLKGIKQRNKILEQINEKGTGYDQISFWDNVIIDNGQLIQSKRQSLLEYLGKMLPDISASINKTKMKLAIEYKKSLMSKDRLKEYFDRDIATRTTLIGPHKDDFVIYDNKHDLSIFGSRGQQRGTILALKLLELEYISQINGFRPVLLLDDIFSEFDQEHRDTIKNVTNKQQTIITTAESLPFFKGVEIISL